MLKRDEELKFKWGTIYPPVRMLVSTQIQWLTEVGGQRKLKGFELSKQTAKDRGGVAKAARD